MIWLNFFVLFCSSWQDLFSGKTLQWLKVHLPVKMSKFTGVILIQELIKILATVVQPANWQETKRSKKFTVLRPKLNTVCFFINFLTFASSWRTWSKYESIFNLQHIHDWYLRHCSALMSDWPRMTDRASSLECLYLGMEPALLDNSTLSTMSDQQSLSVFYKFKKRSTNTKKIKLTVVQKKF